MPTIEEKDYAKNIKKALEKLRRNYYIMEENKMLITEYAKHLIANGYSNSRVYKYLVYLPKMAERLYVPFPEAKERDIRDILLWVRSQDISEATKKDYAVLLKTFYKWIGGGEYPRCVRWIHTGGRKEEKDVVPEDLLTEGDVTKMIETADNPRDKALIAMLWETGARIGEIIDLKIKSFEDYKYGKKIVVHGKTGARKLLLISSVPYVQEWIAVHPEKNNREAYLWINLGTRNKGEKMRYPSINKMLRMTAKKAGIQKPVNPHHFRHSRATYLASRFTEAQLCQQFGWVQGSRVPSTYVHLSGRDLDADYARLYGIKDTEEPEISKMAPKTCPRCGSMVEPDAKFCPRCGMALDEETARKLEEAEGNVLEIFLKNEDPELKKALEFFNRIYEFMKENPVLLKK